MTGMAASAKADVSVTRLKDPRAGLGLALYFLGRREPFGGFPARDLVTTVARHMHGARYLMAFAEGQVVGYFGWELFGTAEAEHFARTGIVPQPGAGGGEDVVWLTVAAADSRAALTALVAALRGLYRGRRVMGVRHKPGRRPFVFSGRFGPGGG